MIVTLDEAKEYLRIDDDEDATVKILLDAAQVLCMHVARFDDEAEFAAAGGVVKEAILFTLGVFYEHRDDFDRHQLTLQLRSLLEGVRRAAF